MKLKKLNPLQRARRALRLAREEITKANATTLRVANDLTAQRVISEDRQRAYVVATEVIAIKDAAIKLREARVAEITAERDRIIRIIDQFLSVQILTHGTQLTLGIAPSAPATLRAGGPSLPAATGVVAKLDGILVAADAHEKLNAKVQQQPSMRRSMFNV